MDMREKVIVALDSFKGCLASGEANRAAAEGLLALNPEAEVIQVPVTSATTARTRLGQGRQEGWAMPSCNTFMPTAGQA